MGFVEIDELKFGRFRNFN